MDCKSCGADISTEGNFCANCGQKYEVTVSYDSVNRSWQTGSDFNDKFFFHPSHLSYLYLSNSGRIERRRYLKGTLLWLGFFGIFSYLMETIFGTAVSESDFYLIPYGLAVLYTLQMLWVKRVHDTNHSWVWLLIPLWWLILYFKQGNPGNNKYGPNPSESQPLYSASDIPVSPTPSQPNPVLESEKSSVCTVCGDTNPTEATHCISCGNKLPSLVCPHCQTENISRAKFCMGCGQER